MSRQVCGRSWTNCNGSLHKAGSAGIRDRRTRWRRSLVTHQLRQRGWNRLGTGWVFPLAGSPAVNASHRRSKKKCERFHVRNAFPPSHHESTDVLHVLAKASSWQHRPASDRGGPQVQGRSVAVHLSLSSFCYAKRKTPPAVANKIEYAPLTNYPFHAPAPRDWAKASGGFAEAFAPESDAGLMNQIQSGSGRAR